MNLKITKSLLFKAAILVAIPFIIHTVLAAHSDWYQGFLKTYLIGTGSISFINSVASTLIGAFFGAAIAFHFQNTKDEHKKQQTEKRLTSTLYYQYIDAYSFIFNYKKVFIDNGKDTSSSEFIVNLMPHYKISYTPFEIDPDLPKFMINHKDFHPILLEINKTKDLINQFINAINNHSNFIFQDFNDTKVKIIHFVEDAKAEGRVVTKEDIINDELVNRSTYTQLEGLVKNIIDAQVYAERHTLRQLQVIRKKVNDYFDGDLPDFLHNVTIIDDEK